MLCDSPTFKKQRINKMSSSRWGRVAWKPKVHDGVMLNQASLGFVYGLLLSNRWYQTDRKIYDESEIAVRLRSSRDAPVEIINSLRENKIEAIYK